MGLGLRFSPLEWDSNSNLFDFGGAGVSGIGYINNVWYVNPNVTKAGSGKSWRKPFKTMSEVISRATTRNDVIMMAPGDYDEGTVIDVTTQGLQIISPLGNRFQNKAMIMDGSSAGYHILTINAHEVVIDGMAISAAADTYDAIKVGTTMSPYKVTIQNCRLDGWSGEYGVRAGVMPYDCPDLAILGNLFRSWKTAAVQVNCTRSNVIGNIFHVPVDTIGIEHIPVGGSRPDNVYTDNDFSGVANASTTGIKFTGAPSDGTIFVSRNNFAGTWDTTITKIAAIAGVNNYVSHGTTGGSLIDTVT